MSVQTIITGDKTPILRAETENVNSFSKNLQKLITDLHDTVTFAKGAGLAAPQINSSLKVCVARVGGTFITLVNPSIIWCSEETDIAEEGCLSLPEVWIHVERPIAIVVRFQNEKGRKEERKLSEIDARVVQHEVDHLHGKLIVDYQEMGGGHAEAEAL